MFRQSEWKPSRRCKEDIYYKEINEGQDIEVKVKFFA